MTEKRRNVNDTLDWLGNDYFACGGKKLLVNTVHVDKPFYS